MKNKEIKIVKSYSLPPSQVAWLRKCAAKESTPEKTVSASNVLERIIDAAIDKRAKQLPLPIDPLPTTNTTKNRKPQSQAASVAA